MISAWIQCVFKCDVFGQASQHPLMLRRLSSLIGAWDDVPYLRYSTCKVWIVPLNLKGARSRYSRETGDPRA